MYNLRNVLYRGQTNKKWNSSSTLDLQCGQNLFSLFVLLYLPVSIARRCDDSRNLVIYFCNLMGIDFLK